MTITLILSALVAFNFILLRFSCNKTTKSKYSFPEITLSKKIPAKKMKTASLDSTQLAATGS